MGGAEGRGVVVEENWPLGEFVIRDYEPGSWWVRSRFGEGLNRNRDSPGIYRSELEEGEVEEDCFGVGAKEGVEFGGDVRRILSICVWRARYGGGRWGRARYHPRVWACLLVLVVVEKVGALTAVQRSPAGMGVVSWNGQAGGIRNEGALDGSGGHGGAQEGGRHPRVPGRTSGAAWGGPRIII